MTRHYEDYELTDAEEEAMFGPDEIAQEALREQEWLDEYDPDEEKNHDGKRVG